MGVYEWPCCVRRNVNRELTQRRIHCGREQHQNKSPPCDKYGRGTSLVSIARFIPRSILEQRVWNKCGLENTMVFEGQAWPRNEGGRATSVAGYVERPPLVPRRLSIRTVFFFNSNMIFPPPPFLCFKAGGAWIVLDESQGHFVLVEWP